MKNKVIFLTTDSIGSGERELGAQLLETFATLLKQREQLPAAVFCVNRGVLALTEQSFASLHLKEAGGARRARAGLRHLRRLLRDSGSAGSRRGVQHGAFPGTGGTIRGDHDRLRPIIRDPDSCGLVYWKDKKSILYLTGRRM